MDTNRHGVERVFPPAAGRVIVTYATRGDLTARNPTKGADWVRVHRDASDFNLRRLRAEGYTHVTLKAAKRTSAGGALLLDDLLDG